MDSEDEQSQTMDGEEIEAANNEQPLLQTVENVTDAPDFLADEEYIIVITTTSVVIIESPAPNDIRRFLNPAKQDFVTRQSLLSNTYRLAVHRDRLMYRLLQNQIDLMKVMFLWRGWSG